MAIKKTPKCRHMMYTQQLNYLPMKDLTALRTIVEQKIHPERYALILHDQETDEKGNPKPPDVHVMMSFAHARHLSSVAHILGDAPQYIEAWDSHHENGYAYLVHSTRQAQAEGKHQYDPSKVIANFDYLTYLKTIQTKAVQKVRQRDMTAKDLLDAMYAGILTKSEVEQRLTGSQLGYYKRQIDAVWSKVLRNRADAWRKEMAEHGRRVTVIWLFGVAGAGKTRLAHEIAGKQGRPYFMSGSSRDIFEDYASESVIVLDELRPKVLAYQDLLRLFDPFGAEVKAPSRYFDKHIAADMIIVTSPYSPYAFWLEQFTTIVKHDGYARKQSLADQGPDGFPQLDRRVAATVMVQPGTIDLVSFSYTDGRYHVLQSRVNPYLQQTDSASTASSEEVFKKMFD